MSIVQINEIVKRSGVNRAITSAVINNREKTGTVYISENAQLAVMKATIQILQEKLVEMTERFTGAKGFHQFDTMEALSDTVYFSDKCTPIEETETDKAEIYVEGSDADFVVVADDVLTDTAIATEQILKGNIKFKKSHKKLTAERLQSIVSKLAMYSVEVTEIESEGLDAELTLEKASAYLSPDAIDKFSELSFSNNK